MTLYVEVTRLDVPAVMLPDTVTTTGLPFGGQSVFGLAVQVVVGGVWVKAFFKHLKEQRQEIFVTCARKPVSEQKVKEYACADPKAATDTAIFCARIY
jgi:hypothetical protein